MEPMGRNKGITSSKRASFPRESERERERERDRGRKNHRTRRVSDRKLKVFSRKETRSGRESGKAKKESQGNVIFPVETDGWVGRTNERRNERSRGGWTDKQASKQQPGRHREASWRMDGRTNGRTKSACRAAGRLRSNDLATSRRRTPEDLYPELAQNGVARRGAAWHGTVGSARFASTRFHSVRNQPRDLLHAIRYSTDIGPILPAFFFFFLSPPFLSLYLYLFLSLLHLFFLHFPRGTTSLVIPRYHRFVSRNLTLSIVTSIDAFSEARSPCVSAFRRAPVQRGCIDVVVVSNRRT